METSPVPRPRRHVLFLLLVLVVLLAGAGGYGWYLYAQLGTHADGTRISLVRPGAAAATAVAAPLPVAPAADLAAGGLQAQHEGVSAEVEQGLFLLREKFVLTVR